MFRVSLIWLTLVSLASAEITDSDAWINEFHYDNDGADEQEFVEVVAPASWTELSNVTLTLYNGSSGSPYGGPIGLDDFTPGDVQSGFVFYTLDVPLQNGAPDGLALARGSDLLQFLSYEGTFTATSGIAQGLDSTDIGFQEVTSTPLGSSLQLGGTGDSYLDFSWQAPLDGTHGLLNRGQSVVPEPSSLLLWLAVAGISLMCRRRWRRTGR